jgi:regulatory protein YycH of two-component signal transduction system YycFG
MAINKTLIHFKNLTAFEAQKAAGNILNTSICFIQDAKKIYTHGQFYDCSAPTADLSQYLTETEI